MKDKEITVTADELQKQKLYTADVAAIMQVRAMHGTPKALVRTYGCQQNVADGERMKGMLSEMGFEFTEYEDEADFILFNTCAIREHAEDRVFGNIGALKNVKRRNPSLLIAVCGCMMEQERVAERIKVSFPFVNIVFGTHVIHRLPEMMYTAVTDSKRVFLRGHESKEIIEGLPVRRDGNTRAWVTVMYGCDNFCSYCIVPYVRGREKSRHPDAIVAECRELIEQGYKEITLLGQNVNSYGKGLPEKVNFSELLRRIDAIDGDYRLRFMTSHPKDATHELVLTSDVIVGFPGETEEEFEDTLRLIERVRYDALFTFIFSPRPGTRAAEMEDPVTYKEKTQWFSELLKTQEEIAAKRCASMVGSTERVLIEERNEKNGLLSGRTASSIIVEFPGEDEWIGEFKNVKVTEARNWILRGECVD